MLLLGIICCTYFFAIDFENNGYKDVVVTVHPDIPDDNGQDIINNIKVFLLEANHS